ncbi:MAG: RNA-binding protein [Acidobacteria bacterium]|nr:RNA-binding protein [Acidobacteriota bacterium]MBV9070582.1 RNA-binding protein [Acidobacteriota bacterium]MBV9187863.1 RNA-binding protein [Acidobacteriota bacterium]
MFPKLAELRTESDVEQKLIWPLLVAADPLGLGYSNADVLTKTSIRRLEIGKGNDRKLYFPDYLIVIAGLPVMIVEAKAVGEPIDDALREGRLYANEINALFPHRVNPCKRVIACNGQELQTSLVDTSHPDISLTLDELSPASVTFAQFVAACGRRSIQSYADDLRRRLRRAKYTRPVSLVGGTSFQNQELAQNTFGATIVGDYGHIFNPKTQEDRAQIVREAYIASLRQQRYIEPIDRLIRNAVAPSASKIRPIEDSRNPREVTTVLASDHKKLENQILLLVGSVGAGKSTFVDYLSLVALPEQVREKTVWVRINLNDAPLALDDAYKWTARAIEEGLRNAFVDLDFDELSTLEKVFAKEINALRKGPLALLGRKSPEAQARLADRLIELQRDPLEMGKAIARFVCGSRRLLLVIVLDNCDKRSRDEQLTMFQLAHWVQDEFRGLIVLPLRDVTYDLHRHDPPLDTALKQFVFRIEPPPFSEVLQARVRLALREMSRDASTASTLSYQLPNGMRVSYPAEDQALYLASILRSLYAHDRFVRQVMTGLAGRDVRLALEIFLEFCLSGHIGEDEIYKIRFFEGQHVLPLSIVARVLLRMSRRFYDGRVGYLKNIVQCEPNDALPDHFARLTILQWYSQRVQTKGPAGVEGFHRTIDLIRDLSAIGHDAERIRAELLYLVREGCVVAEHLRTDAVADSDLAKITSSGMVHLQLMVNPEYLAACAEDTWIGDEELGRRIAGRIGDFRSHFSPVTTTRNAREIVAYLTESLQQSPRGPEVFLAADVDKTLLALREAQAGVAAAEMSLPERLFVASIPFEATEADIRGVFTAAGVELKGVTLALSHDNNRRNRGFAFIQPASPAATLVALERDGEIWLRGRRLRVSEADPIEEEHIRRGGRERPAPALSRRVYLANFPYEYTEVDIRALLAKFDISLSDVYIMRDRDTNKSRGACFVELESIDEAARTIGAVNGVEVNGRRVSARPADPK